VLFIIQNRPGFSPVGETAQVLSFCFLSLAFLNPLRPVASDFSQCSLPSPGLRLALRHPSLFGAGGSSCPINLHGGLLPLPPPSTESLDFIAGYRTAALSPNFTPASRFCLFSPPPAFGLPIHTFAESGLPCCRNGGEFRFWSSLAFLYSLQQTLLRTATRR